MGQIEIIEKLDKELRRDIKEECQVVYILSRVRKILEIKNQNEKMAASHQKIIALFKDKEKLRMKEISKAFPDITSRTLRNHLRGLIDRGLVYNQGKGAGSVYIIKS